MYITSTNLCQTCDEMEYLAGDFDGCDDRSRLWECKADFNKNKHFENVDGHVYAPVVIKFESRDTFAWMNDTTDLYNLETATWQVADDLLID